MAKKETVRINFDISKEENEILERRYKESGMKSKSAYFRKILFDDRNNLSCQDYVEICGSLEKIRRTAGAMSSVRLYDEIMGACDSIYSTIGKGRRSL